MEEGRLENLIGANLLECLRYQLSLKFPDFQISENFRILGGIRVCGGKFPRSNFPKLAEICIFRRRFQTEIVGVKSVEI